MEKYKYVFIVLVYKNIDVLKDFFKSLHISDYKVIVVNSFYDNKSLKECEETALANNADFIPDDNKGFGFGNNVGTEYALNNYNFDYLIMSNSDIHVISLEGLDIVKEENVVIAPYTHLPEGKEQNPNIPWRTKALLKIFKVAYDKESKPLLILARIITRGSRELFKLYNFIAQKELYRIYCCHGSFIIFSKKAVETLYPVFDERVFLYNEELYLAERSRIKNVPILYCPHINVLHLEGASTGTNFDFSRFKNSYSILYEWMKENGCI